MVGSSWRLGGFTVALLKPDAAARPWVVEAVREVWQREQIQVLAEKRLEMSVELASRLYAVHVGKPFQRRLIRQMVDGKVDCFVLGGEKVVERWRRELGPSAFLPHALAGDPGAYDAWSRTLRGRFALSNRRNVAHGSDSTLSALDECRSLFPELRPVERCRDELRVPPNPTFHIVTAEDCSLCDVMADELDDFLDQIDGDGKCTVISMEFNKFNASKVVKNKRDLTRLDVPRLYFGGKCVSKYRFDFLKVASKFFPT